jgi:predicted RNA-binding Zn-ribbon protein involved in translation (DUF1610 family)
MTETRSGKFIPIYLCASCQQELTREQRVLNGGVCPKCGAISEETIVEVTKASKWIDIEPEKPREPSWFERFLGLV